MIIVPKYASSEYLSALVNFLVSQDLRDEDSETYKAVCLAFMEGWAASKQNTLNILESIQKESPDVE